ncbi:MAG: RNA polymerase-associated protein RapA [Acidobacteria bacterium]|nr:RNA polymerase-associated protein RapA [Acidobacteriota bacterium]
MSDERKKDDFAAPGVDKAALKLILKERVFNQEPNALQAALPALNAYPNDAEVLLLTILAALMDEKPDQAMRFLHRFTKNWQAHENEDQLLRAIALAQQELWAQAAQIGKQIGWPNLYSAFLYLPGGWALRNWAHGWVRQIERFEDREKRSVAAKKAAEKRKAENAKSPHAAKLRQEEKVQQVEETIPTDAATETPQTAQPEFAPLPRYRIRIPLSVELPNSLEAALAVRSSSDESDRAAFRLRYELAHLGLLQGFDELLCLPTLRDVETYWYQLETVRKVLKQFRGRVLLADEVGLGKTIEAGMVLKEYLLRGMAERVLVLTPATLVGQWREEMAAKFGIEFATSYDSLLRNDPEKFWTQPRVIASIAMARRQEHQEILAKQNYDLVIVDEAHHLKNRATANWKLVNALNKRFLLLLSATPVQNSLVELYNLLTLLKPGIFKTEKEFRASYMTSGKPRTPANKETMRDLMRDVMIRNTRSLVDVKLPPRHATTLRLEPSEEERACYLELTGLVADAHRKATAQQRMALRYLLSAAGSTTTTAAGAIGRYLESKNGKREWKKLQERYAGIQPSSKEQALIELLHRNPAEKKMVFVHHRETLHRLAELVKREGVACEQFEGGMTGPEKDAAVRRFHDEVPLLICTESGGEGRNMQFCNTLINFDLPWNPMTIEQRIGRIHRIGQTRDVFVFNLAARGTLEEQVLKILDEKINMFELVVGEIGEILGEMDEEQDFGELVYAAWIETTEAERESAFEQLGERLVEAKQQYEEVKALDEELFGEEFVTG